jgi:hypothetical protein
MSMTLILWKAPVVDNPEATKDLLQPYYDRGDDSAFQSSPDIARVANELLQRFPDAENGPWADGPPEPADRVLCLTIRWGADNAVLDAIAQLAREYELVLYDPQGPDVQLPTDPVAAGPPPTVRLLDYGKILLMGLTAAGIFLLGWRIEVPVLNWILMIAGGFFLSVVLFLLGILLFGPKDVTG